MVGDWFNFLIDIEGGDTEYDPQNEVYQPMQVRDITSFGVNDGEVSSYEGVVNDIAQLQPIPLTAQILEKNGFKNLSLNDPELINYVFKASFVHKSPLPNVEVLRVNYYDGVEWDFYALLGERESSDCGEQYEYIIIVKFVHELQHALRLAGIEKTIEL